MEERRRSVRRRTLLTGRIVFRDMSTFECVVRDLSEAGARLRCDQQVVLPEAFCLAIEKLGEKRPARAIWRRDGDIGLAFVS
ncbi:PilZ domain-containing protein [Methylocystis parvus]|uniref:PilZ domain-containing protein n=1 Tax=Methylocystis parvus TaxID=134 RepID=A0A6B8MC39_9HYPH|nr:PilZ domain-containing protein [Methylocystis parvus]QGM99179.1 PilZ domain-containing protein [Methylocystis parvus]